MTSNLSTAPSSVCLDIVDLWWHSRQSTKKSTTSSTVHGNLFFDLWVKQHLDQMCQCQQACFKITKILKKKYLSLLFGIINRSNTILAKLEWFLPHFKKVRRELKVAFFLVNVIINNCFALTIIVNLNWTFTGIITKSTNYKANLPWHAANTWNRLKNKTQGSCGSWKTRKVLESYSGITLESPGKRLLVLGSPWNLLNLSKKYEVYGRQ